MRGGEDCWIAAEGAGTEDPGCSGGANPGDPEDALPPAGLTGSSAAEGDVVRATTESSEPTGPATDPGSAAAD